MIANAAATTDSRFEIADFDAVVFSDKEIRSRLPRAVQVAAAVVVVVAHIGFWWILQWISRPSAPIGAAEDALLIDFITRAPLPEKKQPTRSLAASESRNRIAEPRIVEQHASAPATPVLPDNDAPTPLLYNDDGSIRIPEQVLADLAKLRSDERSFSFQQPGLERAAKLLQHQSPLEYRATRFDKYWQPNQDMLTELLTKAVEASTKEIRIPIPGDPRHHVVCKVSLLAMGGGCGIEGNGDPDALLPGHDDPNTLSAQEDRACQAWWEKIIAAKTQDEWRRTRQLYEQECRKPLAQQAPLPAMETIKAPSGP
jgi:hypothetical protein